MGQKHLTIREARNAIESLENELDLYLTQKKINFQKTQPGAVALKEVVTSKSNNIFDRFTHYVIKDEIYDTKIYGLQESILSYQEYIIKEMKRISKNGGSELIVYLRDEERLPWKQICKVTHYSDKQVRRIYKKGKDDRQ